MCRLFGSIRTGDSSNLPHEIFSRLVSISKAGGPDSTGYYLDDRAQFGFNRLAIIDTSHDGNQPITSPSNRFILMLNGEIYNYKDLSVQHSLKKLRSGSDAEVVSHLLELLPFEEVIDKLNGMFAISVWDTLENTIYLARDFAGIKPLFYAHNNAGLIFGSQFNQILQHPWIRPWSWSATGLREYLQFGFMPPPLTVADQVYQLTPGTWLKYSCVEKKVQITELPRLFEKISAIRNETNRSALDSVHKTLQQAVKRQLVADVPLGIFLSGGIDSGLIAALASKIRPDVETLTIGFEQESLDESQKAAEYARILKLKNNRIILSQNQLLEIFEDHNQALTEPIADYSTIPTFLISKAAASRFKVMLSGDGGDELFWGYPRFRTFARSSILFNIPSTIMRRGLRKLLKNMGRDVSSFAYEHTLGTANLAFHSYLSPTFLDTIWPNSKLSENLLDEFKCNTTKRDDILLYLRQNEFYQHLQKILVKVDRMSMANGLEVRVPLLDKEVIHYAESIKPNMLQTHQELKWVLKNILNQYIPKDIIYQQKKGFTPPLSTWARTILKDQIRGTLQEGLRANLPVHNIRELISYGEGYLKNEHQNLEGMWTIYALLVWKKNLQ